MFDCLEIHPKCMEKCISYLEMGAAFKNYHLPGKIQSKITFYEKKTQIKRFKIFKMACFARNLG